MKTPRFSFSVAVIAAVAGLPWTCRAQGSPDLKTLQFEYDVQIAEEGTGPYRAGVAKLNTAYQTSLTRELNNAKSAGDLEGAVAIDAEIKRLSNQEALPAGDDAIGEPLKKLRAIYRGELAKLEAQRLMNEARVRAPFEAKLKELEVALTKAGRLEEAVAALEYRKGLASPPAKPLAPITAPIAKATTPAAPKPATPIVSPPVPTTEPLAPTLQAGAEGILVAGEIRAKAQGKDIAPGVIFFEAPKGDGRRSPKGVLLKNSAGTAKSGSTWTFKWTRSLSGQHVQIIHPAGKGHLIVQIGPNGVEIKSPSVWQDAGWRGGDKKNLRLSSDFDKIFPIKDDIEYDVLSRVSGSGSLELFLNGTQVCSGRVGREEPLMIQKEGEPGNVFISEELPTQWEPDWAAVIIGPVDSGVSMARELRFHAGLLPVPGAKQ
jgi:hypothetical protein